MSIMVNVGFGNMVSVQRIVAIVTPESAPIKRMVTRAKDSDKLIDTTHGRRTRSVIILDSGHIVLSLLQPSTISDRAGKDIPADKETET